MVPSLRGGFQATPPGDIGFNAWHWLKVQRVRILIDVILYFWAME